MEDIPGWIIKVIKREKLICRGCKTKFEATDLMSIGIQKSGTSPHKDYLCIGLYCSKCKELIIFEIKEMSLVNFAFEILDQETTESKKVKKDDTGEIFDILDKPKKQKKKKIKKSKITKKEIDDIRDFLKPKDLKHEEFLMALGMSPEEINKYNYVKKKKKR